MVDDVNIKLCKIKLSKFGENWGNVCGKTNIGEWVEKSD